MNLQLLARAGSEAARQAAMLAGALGELGHAASLIEIAATPGPAIDVAFERAQKSDVAHVFGGPCELACALLVDAPVVLTLPRALGADDRALAERMAGRAALVSSTEQPGSITLRARIAPPASDQESRARSAREYAQVYASLRAGAARADREHDARPWGEYWVLEDRPDFKLKRIDVLARRRLSYQKHARRSEHWIVVRGRARVTLDGREIELELGGTIDIPCGAAHRIENVGDELLTFIEIQSGSYFGEDDIVRLEDDFGRAR